MAVNGGILLSLFFFDIFDLKLLRFISFFLYAGSCWASCSWTSALATSRHARRYLSFSGGKTVSLGSRRFSDIRVMVSVAIVEMELEDGGVKS